MNIYDIIIVGGGAAGFFTAINIADNNPTLKIAILERGKEVLTKVRVSGGGRCNVTHACFEIGELVKNYPRGERELRGPFNQFCAQDTIEWFKNRGVELKTEADGRMFPVSNSSQTIVDCFVDLAKKAKIDILTGQSVQTIYKSENGWKLDTATTSFQTRSLIMATGSNPKIWELLEKVGHSIVKAVPSLFTFNIVDSRIKELPGVSAMATVFVNGTKLKASGPLLVTHWGMSGPAILKLSAWGARILADFDYQFDITINWLNDVEYQDAIQLLKNLKLEESRKAVGKKCPFEFPNRLWEKLVSAAGISDDVKWADFSKIQMQHLATQLTQAVFQVNGKSTFKEEFVTAGGIALTEINFKTMQSKLHDNLYFAGEIVNIDAITGGFNFQNAWTAGYIVAKNFK